MERLVLAWATFTVCGVALLGTAISTPRQAPPAGSAILDAARTLATGRALSKAVIEETLDVALAVDATASHSAVTFLTGVPRPGSRYERIVSLVDLRVPTPQNRAMKGPFLHVELRADAGVDAGLLEASFGRPARIDVPEPNPRYAVTYIYALRPSPVRFSIGAGPTRPVVGFSIDRSGVPR